MKNYTFRDGEIVSSRELELIARYRNQELTFCVSCGHQLSHESKDGYFYNYRCSNKECEECRE
jgi:hypothetical protein